MTYYVYQNILPENVDGNFSFYQYDTGDVFYLGKGKNERDYSQISDAKRYAISVDKSIFSNNIKLTILSSF